MSQKHPKSAPTTNRSRTIVKSGYLFIFINFLLGVFNFIIGLLAGSVAITSDATHSFIDSISGFLVVVSEKLAKTHKLTKHRAKIERYTTILIALIIIITGIHIIVESIEKLITPESPDYSIYAIIVLIASIALKYTLTRYLRHAGKRVNSSILIASATETMNDTWISVAVLASAIVYLLTGIDVEAYISLIIALIIIKVGLEFIFPHLSSHHHHHLESDPDHDHCGHPTSDK